MPLKEHLDELNSVLMELHDIDVKMEDEDLAMILLAYLPSSYNNFVSSLSVGKDSIILEEVKSTLYSRKLQLKAYGNGDEAFASILLVTYSTKEQKKKKDKGVKKSKVDPKDIYNYNKESNHWRQDYPKKAKKDSIDALV